MISVKNLRKVYPDNAHVALLDINFDVKAGEIYGILGENGSGKTTLIKILSTQIAPTAGTATIENLSIDKDRREIRRIINCISGGETGLYPWLSAMQNLELFAHLYNVKLDKNKTLLRNLLSEVQLSEKFWNQRVGFFSKGMMQKVLIARGLVNNPRVVFLDEPTIGLDVKAISSFRNLIKNLSGKGVTIIVTSHNMEDIVQLCDRTSILKDGKILETIDVKGSYLDKSILSIELDKNPSKELKSELQEKFHISFVSGNCFVGDVESVSPQIILQFLTSENMQVKSFEVRTKSLEEYYLRRISC